MIHPTGAPQNCLNSKEVFILEVDVRSPPWYTPMLFPEWLEKARMDRKTFSWERRKWSQKGSLCIRIACPAEQNYWLLLSCTSTSGAHTVFFISFSLYLDDFHNLVECRRNINKKLNSMCLLTLHSSGEAICICITSELTIKRILNMGESTISLWVSKQERLH
jgi:hypothetical protein